MLEFITNNLYTIYFIGVSISVIGLYIFCAVDPPEPEDGPFMDATRIMFLIIVYSFFWPVAIFIGIIILFLYLLGKPLTRKKK